MMKEQECIRPVGIVYSAIESFRESDKTADVRVLASLVVRTYNEERFLPELFEAVRHQLIEQEGRVEVILVDSGSTDRTVAIAKENGAKIVSIRKEEFSFGRSLNLGCQAASGELLVFISGHCVPCNPAWLAELLAPFRDPYVGAVYGRQIGGDESKFSEKQVFAKYYPPQEKPTQGPYFCNNANSAVRRSLWRRFPFDETLTGLEDMHFGKRMSEDRFRIAYASKAVVYHHHNETWKQVWRRYEREAIALKCIHPELHLGLLDIFSFLFAALVSDLKEATKEKIVFKEFTSIVAYRFCQFFGSWSGGREHRQLSQKEKYRYYYPI